MTARLHGREAIEYAEAHGLTLSKYTDPIEDAREGLSIEEAEEVLREDPHLIYVDVPSVPLARLTELVRSEERARAPGSETILWGDFTARIAQVTGHAPYDDHPEDASVPLTEAAWWLGAYAAQEAALHLGDEAPASPLDGDYETIRTDLDLEARGGGDQIDVAIEEGYSWVRENHPDLGIDGPRAPEPPSGDEIRTWRSGMGWTQEQAAAALGLGRVHLADLERGAKQAQGYLRLAMERLESLHG